MLLAPIDWILIGLYLIISFAISLYFKKESSRGLESYFLGGRKLPWYLAGLSMVATTFAADTPLLVTEIVNKNGISGNWIWWNMLIGGMLTTFFFSKLWYRTGVLTELEFIELRYEGKSGAFLRGFKSLYLGLFMNTLIIAWVNLALIAIFQVFFNIPSSHVLIYVAGAMILASVYTALSGLLGITFTDAFQFIIAIAGCIVLAIMVIGSDKIGGLSGLKATIISSHSPDYLRFFPKISNAQGAGEVLTISVLSFIAFIGIQWWASWYPGAEPGGGGYVAQRMMSTKNEKHSLLATLFFQVAHYALRPWPWILVGLASVILYPHLPADDKKLGYVLAIKDFMPAGFTGLMIVAMLAAYMSTISTQLNWGASFLVNDLYGRFLNKKISGDHRHMVLAGKAATLIIMALSLVVTTIFSTIREVWEFLIAGGAGLGLVLILRWFWWRVNAWSEIAATIVPIPTMLILNRYTHIAFPESLFFLVTVTTTTWITITLLTKPVSPDTLTVFYKKVQPYGWWKPISKQTHHMTNEIKSLMICWGSSIVFVYSLLFLIGYLLLLEHRYAVMCGTLVLLSGYVLYRKSYVILS